MTNHLAAIEQLKTKFIDQSGEFVPKLIVALIILCVGFFVGRWVANIAHRWMSKLELEPPVRLLMVRMVRLLVFGLFLVLALQNLGVQLMPLIAGLGIAGAGVALALQGPLSNVAAGLVIIFTKPFRVSEYVSVAGVEGRVETIDLFNTVLSHPDLSRIVIPNRDISGEILHNYGKIRQLTVNVGVAYDTDLNVALGVIHEVLRDNHHVLKEPAPVVRVAMLADSSINIAVMPWVNIPDYGAAGGEINKAIVEVFRSRNVSIPFPQREIRLLNPPEEKENGGAKVGASSGSDEA
jgi:small conductance mechanosensitive channel